MFICRILLIYFCYFMFVAHCFSLIVNYNRILNIIIYQLYVVCAIHEKNGIILTHRYISFR